MVRCVKQILKPKFDVYLCGATDVASIYQSACPEFEYWRDFYFSWIRVEFSKIIFSPKMVFFCQFQQMLETISNYQKFLVTRFQRSFYVSLFFNSGIIKHINSNLWNRSVSKMITFICFNQKQFFNFFLKFNLFFTQWLTSKFLY